MARRHDDGTRLIPARSLLHPVALTYPYVLVRCTDRCKFRRRVRIETFVAGLEKAAREGRTEVVAGDDF
jgi:hypothetical protein